MEAQLAQILLQLQILPQISATLDNIETRLDGIDVRLDAMDRRFDAVEGRLDDHDRAIESINEFMVQEFNIVYDKFEKLERAIEQGFDRTYRYIGLLMEKTYGEFRMVSETVGGQGERLDGHEFRIDQLERSA